MVSRTLDESQYLEYFLWCKVNQFDYNWLLYLHQQRLNQKSVGVNCANPNPAHKLHERWMIYGLFLPDEILEKYMIKTP